MVIRPTVAWLGACVLLAPLWVSGQNQEFQKVQAHFARVAGERHGNLFRGITTVSQWEQRKQILRSNLIAMLWHERRWPEHPPRVNITGRVARERYTIENLVLETAPDLYVTANLYLPRADQPPFPVILYQCGHANKNKYARHGAWFAARGIAVLVMDNIEMGELEFTHHGVYAHAWFHWYSRGFSPLAVELFNARRALDYLCARTDLDPHRIGATGRSGGGMTSFFLAAIDDRIKACAPVSGTLSTSGWIRQQLSSSHCDCQYPINSHALLYSEVGALIAPRSQLLANADADRGFPMDAFNEMAVKIREIYRVYGVEQALKTAVTSGGHADTEAIRAPVYSFFLKEFLRIEQPIVSEGPVDEPSADELVCFREGLPPDERLSRVDEEFIPRFQFSAAQFSTAVFSGERRQTRLAQLTRQLRDHVFRYFPHNSVPLDPTWSESATRQGRTIKQVTFRSFPELTVRGLYSLPAGSAARSNPPKLPAILLVDHRKGIPVWGNEQPLERNRWGDRAVLILETLDRGSRALEQNLRSFSDDDLLHHLRRQAMIAGTTIESMQVYEILRGLELLRAQPEVDPKRIAIVGKGESGINGMYAAILDGTIERVILGSPPASHVSGPHYLGILKYTDIPEGIALMQEKIKLYGEIPEPLRAFFSGAALDRSLVRESLLECLQ